MTDGKDDKEPTFGSAYARFVASAVTMPWMIADANLKFWAANMGLPADWWKRDPRTIHDPEVLEKTIKAQTEQLAGFMKIAASQADYWGKPWRDFRRNPDNKVWIEGLEEIVDAQWEMWKPPESKNPSEVVYSYSKDMFDQQLGFLPPAMRTYVKAMLSSKSDNELKELLHSRGLAAVLENLGHAFPGRGELAKKEFNHKFLTEDSQGEVVAVDVKKIDKLFPRTNGLGEVNFPHIILTSSHAKGDSRKDVTDITRGIQALARDSNKGEKLRIAHVNGDIAGDADNTLILFACDTERNALLNAAELLYRLDDLRKVAGGKEPDTFESASPGAKRMAKLILRQMASEEDYKKIDINDTKSISQIFANEHITLRARPELIAQHFQLIGYSKGGNVVSDAMRYLVSELNAKNADGGYVVQMNGHVASEEEQQGYVRNLVRNIACMSIAALEVEMEEHYKNCGVRRVSFNNENDMISNHMHFEGTWGDRKWKVKGVEQRQGHDPQDAMGKLPEDIKQADLDKMSEVDIKKACKGYLLDDPRVSRLMKESFAPLYGKAAISSISFIDPRVQEGTGILVGTAPGTPDEMLVNDKGDLGKAGKLLVEKMGDAGLTNVKLKCVSSNNGRAFILSADEDLRGNFGALQKLYNGFHALRDESTIGLVVADRIIKDIDNVDHVEKGIIPQYAQWRHKGETLSEPQQGRSAA